MTSLVWFRRDLRLCDNPALTAACARGAVICVYVHAPHEEGAWAPGAASNWWLHHALAALDASLRPGGGRLVVLAGDTEPALLSLARATGAARVYWNRRYEPAVIARDAALKDALRTHGLDAVSHNAALLTEPWQIRTQQGAPYRVFTPYWRNAAQFATSTAPEPVPRPLDARVPASLPCVAEVSIDALGLLPTIRWDLDFHAHWQPGEAGARAALTQFLDEAIADYREDRDRPAIPGTSRLSPYLAAGNVSPRQIVAAIEASGAGDPTKAAAVAAYVRELGWREFSHHLLYHFPQMVEQNLDAAFERFAWAEPDARLLAAWQRGRTGIPIVDAGMRELWQTGWMHNRVRMVVASLLTKNLRYHWLHGARWFWDTLVDADLANNSQGWQWTAGTGVDAAPYFRVFNPVLQGERFDADGSYVRRYVPELAKVPASAIHRPWTLRPLEQAEYGIAGSVYADPLIDLAAMRAAALAAYQAMRA